MATQSTLHYLPHSHIHTLMAEAAVQGAELLIRNSLGFGILLKDTSTCSKGGFEPVTFHNRTNKHSDG